MRCPQCGERVPVDFAAVRLTGDDFVLLQLKCETCDAYIVLHASLQGIKPAVQAVTEGAHGVNASSALCLTDDQVNQLRGAIESAGGPFNSLFESSKKQ